VVVASDTVSVSGSRQEGPADAACAAITSGGSDGQLTFSVDGSGCSFSYVQSDGRTWTSTIVGAPSFDGTTYVCSYSQSSYVPGIDGPCPEFGWYKNGLTADVALTVSRATGDVTLKRICKHVGAGCSPPNVTNATTLFAVEGSVSCTGVGGAAGQGGAGGVAGSGGSGGGAGASASFCANSPPNTVFCDDFDAVATPADGWTSVAISGPPGSSALDSADYASAPASLDVSIPYATGSSFQSIYLLHEDATLPQAAFTLAFRVRPHAWGTSGPTTLVEAALGTPSSSDHVMLFIDAGHLQLDDGADFDDLGPVVADTWVSIAIVATTTSIKAYKDGVLVVDKPATFAPAAGPVFLRMGLMGFEFWGPYEVQYDDVVLTSP
jgi:hypothetical protein